MTAIPSVNRFELRALQLRLRDEKLGYLTKDEQRLANEAMEILLSRLAHDSDRNHDRWRYMPPETFLGADPWKLDDIYDIAAVHFPLRLDKLRVDSLIYRAHKAGRRDMVKTLLIRLLIACAIAFGLAGSYALLRMALPWL